jgi:galactokinase
MPHTKDFNSPKAQEVYSQLYGPSGVSPAPKRFAHIESEFFKRFGQGEYRLFSAPGRTEIGGNHTDHNNGRVLAAAVSLDTVAAVRINGKDTVRLKSEGFDGEFIVDLSQLAPVKAEAGTTNALIRGVAARMGELGYRVGGFDAYVTSTVLKGSGLSSSAAFEVLIAAILDGLFNASEMDVKLRAQIAQYAENIYFGKPSGLMDQMASSVGGLVAIDFKDDGLPVVKKVPFDFNGMGFLLAVTDTGGSHANLTHEYAAIPADMRSVAEAFGLSKLREVDPLEFYRRLPELHGKVSDRALLRAMHFFGDNERVVKQVQALQAADMEAFFGHIVESGESSWKLLQNCAVGGSSEQGVTLALALSERMLRGRGAWRVHGGGFAGTILAFVPETLLGEYTAEMERVFGEKTCTVLSIRQPGAMEIQI